MTHFLKKRNWDFLRDEFSVNTKILEPWSSGYVRRLMSKKSWVQILAPCPRWTWHFSHWFVVQLYCLLEKTENKWNRGGGWPINFFWANCVTSLGLANCLLFVLDESKFFLNESFQRLKFAGLRSRQIEVYSKLGSNPYVNKFQSTNYSTQNIKTQWLDDANNKIGFNQSAYAQLVLLWLLDFEQMLHLNTFALDNVQKQKGLSHGAR